MRIVINEGDPMDYPVTTNDLANVKQFVVAGHFPVVA
jgi:hypothetical protein